jgi:hypothetical protein
MYTASLNTTEERDGLRGFIAAALAALLVVALLAVAPAPASADGSTPSGTTKVMTASNGGTGFGLTPGDVLTLSFDAGKTPVGNFFDTWLCEGTTYAPDAIDIPAAAEAGCFPFLFWDRTANNNALSMSFVFGLEDSSTYPNSDLSGTAFTTGMDGLVTWIDLPIVSGGILTTNGEALGLSEPCELNGLYFIVHDFSGGGHSNFLGPLSGIPCTSTQVLPPVLTCSPDPAVPGGTLTCEVTGGDPDTVIQWGAAFDDVTFENGDVQLGSSGVGSFVFTVPSDAACGTITVELVDRLPPMSVGVDCDSEDADSEDADSEDAAQEDAAQEDAAQEDAAQEVAASVPPVLPPALPVLTCSPDPAVPGGTLTCEVTGGDPDIDILWRAAFDGSVFVSQGVRLGPDGVGSFSFSVPRGAACGTIALELVEWLPPMTVNVACSPVPTSLPAGEGGVPGPLALLGVLTLAGAAVLVRRMGVAAS